MPRLSVDIDFDYNPNDEKIDMEESRARIKAMLLDHMESEDYVMASNSRFMQSLDGIHFQYTNSAGNRDTIKIEINYSLRAHILESVEVNTITRIFDDNIIIRTVAPLEIFAAKGNALINRAAARDLYDFSNMIEANMFDGRRDLFRKAIVFYASISSTTINRTFDTREIDSIDFGKIKRDLFPVIEIKPNFEEW